jgi:hypothetical protein
VTSKQLKSWQKEEKARTAKRKPAKNFKTVKANGKWSVIAVPIVAYHLPAIVMEAADKSQADDLVRMLNNAVDEWQEMADNS